MTSKSSNFEQEQRGYIRFRSTLKNTKMNIHTELFSVCGDEALSFTTFKRWVKLIREGRETTEDRPRAGDRYRQYSKNRSRTHVNFSEMILLVLLRRFIDILRSQREAYIEF